MNNRKLFEEGLLQAMDAIASQSKDNTTKLLADLLKSAILKPYKEAYYLELSQGRVHKENVEKAVDFYFCDICASLRQMPGIDNEVKEREINTAKNQLRTIKEYVLTVLSNNGIVIIA